MTPPHSSTKETFLCIIEEVTRVSPNDPTYDIRNCFSETIKKCLEETSEHITEDFIRALLNRMEVGKHLCKMSAIPALAEAKRFKQFINERQIKMLINWCVVTTPSGSYSLENHVTEITLRIYLERLRSIYYECKRAQRKVYARHTNDKLTLASLQKSRINQSNFKRLISHDIDLLLKMVDDLKMLARESLMIYEPIERETRGSKNEDYSYLEKGKEEMAA